eukprot:321688-Hanusia_phi.AAC.1
MNRMLLSHGRPRYYGKLPRPGAGPQCHFRPATVRELSRIGRPGTLNGQLPCRPTTPSADHPMAMMGREAEADSATVTVSLTGAGVSAPGRLPPRLTVFVYAYQYTRMDLNQHVPHDL